MLGGAVLAHLFPVEPVNSLSPCSSPPLFVCASVDVFVWICMHVCLCTRMDIVCTPCLSMHMLTLLYVCLCVSVCVSTLQGFTPLMLAAMTNNAKAIRALARFHPDPNALSADGNTALAQAVALGRWEAAATLLECFPRLHVDHFGWPHGRSPLTIAVSNNLHDLTVLLLDAGADVDLPCEDGWVQLTCLSGCGPPSTTPPSDGSLSCPPACHLGCSCFHSFVFTFYPVPCSSPSLCPLPYLCLRTLPPNNIPLLQYTATTPHDDNHSLLQHNASSHCSNTTLPLCSLTPMFLAAAGGYDRLVFILFQRGARLDPRRGSDGATPLHKAVLFYQPKIVKLIADKFRISTRAKDQVPQVLQPLEC